MATTEATGRVDATTDRALEWLRAALWAADADVDLRPVDAADPRATWLARPDAEAPALLVPLGSDRAAAATARRAWDGMPARRRLRGWAGEAFLRSGLARRTWPGRVALLAADPDLHDPDRSLVARLAAHLGEGPLLVAATLRPGAFNGKPVLQLFTGAGRPLAFAKVAVDDLTAGYVENEVHWLRRAARAAGPLRAPRLLDRLPWLGRPVALLEALALPRVPRRRPGWADARVIQAVADLGDRRCTTVARSGGLERCRAAAGLADDGFAELVDGVVARYGDAEVEVGAWHGDFSPWNTASAGRRLLVWDWELAADGMPVGADGLHRAIQLETHVGGAAARDALTGASPLSPAATALYRLELVRRDREAALAGRPDEWHGLGAAARRLLVEAHAA